MNTSGYASLVLERRSFSRNQVVCHAVRIFIVPERYEFRLHVPGGLELTRSVRPVAARPALQPAEEVQ